MTKQQQLDESGVTDINTTFRDQQNVEQEFQLSLNSTSKSSDLVHIPVTDTNKESKDTEAPDGGFGWLIVLASFLSLFVQFGINYSYGVFLTHYLIQYKDRAGIARLSLLGTICSSVTMFMSVISGRLADRIGYRYSIWGGGILFSLGLLLASFAKEVWVLILTQGVMMGLGASAIFIPVLSAPSQWFTRRRGLAGGIASTGSGIGGLVLSPLIEKMVSLTSVPETLRYLSLLSLIVFGFTGCITRNRVPPTTKVWIDWRRFLNPSFRTFFFAEFVFAMVFVVPIFLLTTYAQEQGFTRADAALALGLLNGASAIGRISAGILADYLGSLNVLISCGFLTSLAALLIWPFATTLPLLYFYSIIYGLTSGGFVALVPISLAHTFGTTNLASDTGLIYFGCSIPVLVGTPLASWLLESTSPNYPDQKYFLPTIYYIGSILFCAALGFSYLRFKINSTFLQKL